MQQRLWFLDQLTPGHPVNNLPHAWRLRGPLNRTALQQSLDAVVERHHILRTTFEMREGQPVQVVAPATTISISTIDLQTLSPMEREPEMQRQATMEVRQPFDLTHGPVMRAALLCLAAEDHVFVLTVHHTVFDGWSAEIFWREFAALYQGYCTGQPTQLPALSIQYVDFAAWQQQRLQSEHLDAQLAYWRQQLQGHLPILSLPTDRPHPPIRTDRGTRQRFRCTPSLTMTLKTWSQQHGVTLFMLLLTAFKALLYRYTGETDLLVGTPVASRLQTETESLIGCFVNTLVLRTDLSGNPRFREAVERVRTVALNAYAHQELPFARLVQALQPERSTSHHPLFQVMFILHNTPSPTRQLWGLDVQPVTVDSGTSPFDMTLSMQETDLGLRGWIEYNTDVFEAATISRLQGHWQNLLAAIASHAEQPLATLPLLTEAEQRQIVAMSSPTEAETPPELTLHALFEAQAERTPEAVAVVDEDQHLTYRELNRRANQLAYQLQALRVGPEARVGLLP